MKESKFILLARSFQGVIIMAISVGLNQLGYSDPEAVGAFVSTLLNEGAFTFGLILSVVGTVLRKKKVHVFKP